MKSMILVGLLALAGCAALSTKVAPKVASAVSKYCQESQETRLALRGEINSLIAPNTIQVNCEADKVSGVAK